MVIKLFLIKVISYLDHRLVGGSRLYVDAHDIEPGSEHRHV